MNLLRKWWPFVFVFEWSTSPAQAGAQTTAASQAAVQQAFSDLTQAKNQATSGLASYIAQNPYPFTAAGNAIAAPNQANTPLTMGGGSTNAAGQLIGGGNTYGNPATATIAPNTATPAAAAPTRAPVSPVTRPVTTASPLQQQVMAALAMQPSAAQGRASGGLSSGRML